MHHEVLFTKIFFATPLVRHSAIVQAAIPHKQERKYSTVGVMHLGDHMSHQIVLSFHHVRPKAHRAEDLPRKMSLRQVRIRVSARTIG